MHGLYFRNHYSFTYFFAVWYGVIFIRQGIYQEGIFRFKLFIPDNFPDGDCPVSQLFLNLH